MINIDSQLNRAAAVTEAALSLYLPKTEIPGCTTLIDSMKYSLFSGGKRIRPYLTLLFCRMFGGQEEDALPLACALEMVHTYSLIHDDLPAVDNDDMRRGRPTNHKVYGEAGALFAGDALLTQAFSVLASHVPAHKLASAVKILADGSGALGMLGGQMLDIEAEKRALTYDELVCLQQMKTGALMQTAVRFGLLAANITDAQIREDADLFASDIGLAFQIIDDILDKYGDAALLGKNTGSDAMAGKTTFLSFFSREQAMQHAHDLTKHAINTISRYPHTEEAAALAEYLLQRIK